AHRRSLNNGYYGSPKIFFEVKHYGHQTTPKIEDQKEDSQHRHDRGGNRRDRRHHLRSYEAEASRTDTRPLDSSDRDSQTRRDDPRRARQRHTRTGGNSYGAGAGGWTCRESSSESGCRGLSIHSHRRTFKASARAA